ncbi:hypothetical protein [uncultured Clostridium sp.]|jgi:hypothetical protein|uniref:hypothetical protein n=1 Tax=uncultured Clostridium sp. TaxID=59620 RepID=UPI002638AFEC|nr:hypothetical protein [uncultured Clostridium sp.]
MGLKLIPETSYIYIPEKSDVDVWGLAKSTDLKKKYGCFLRESEQVTPVESIGGKQILPSYDISFNGKVEIRAGDKIEVDGVLMEVLKKSVSKDISGNVLLTKIIV